MRAGGMCERAGGRYWQLRLNSDDQGRRAGATVAGEQPPPIFQALLLSPRSKTQGCGLPANIIFFFKLYLLAFPTAQVLDFSSLHFQQSDASFFVCVSRLWKKPRSVPADPGPGQRSTPLLLTGYQAAPTISILPLVKTLILDLFGHLNVKDVCIQMILA